MKIKVRCIKKTFQQSEVSADRRDVAEADEDV